MNPATVMRTPSLRRFTVLALVAVLWTAAVVAGGWWWQQDRSQRYLDQSAMTASVRLVAVKDTLALTLRQLAAMPLNMAHRSAVMKFLAVPREPFMATRDDPQAAGNPDFVEVRLMLDRASADFGLPLVALLDNDGVMVASNSAPNPPPFNPYPNAPSRFNTRDYFIEAMAKGASMQFLLGRASRSPGVYFANRVDLAGRPIGMVLVKQEAEALNRLLSDGSGTRVLVTDANGVIVLSNQAELLLQRLPNAPPHPDAFWQAIYQRVPPVLPWTALGDAKPGQGEAVALQGIDGVQHTVASGILGDTPFRAWVLDPLDEQPQLLSNTAFSATAIWVIGSLLIWLAWRRLHLLDAALGARREMFELTQALPLTVFRYVQPANGTARFTFLGSGASGLFGVAADALDRDPTLPWRLADGSAQPPMAPREFMVRRGDEAAWLLADSAATPNADGGTTFNGYWLDISARRETQARLAAVFEHAPASYLFFDAKRGITHCNPATLALFGAERADQVVGRILWYPALSAERQVGGRLSTELALERMREHTGSRARVRAWEWRFKRLDGTEFDADVQVVALEWEGVPQFCAILRDITASKQVEVAMQQARDAAEAASQTKSSFLANMSHELRTPMNAIIGMTHLALEDGLPPKQYDYVEKAHGAARKLLQILNDILDVSKIEAGQLTLERIDFEVEAVVSDMADVLGLKADEKGLELLFAATPDLPRRLVGDPTRLRQVLVNLGSNAIKFTDRGEVTVGMEVAASEGDTVELHAWVRDTGVGLAEADIERLFQPFTQGDSSTTRRFGGTGLGLVISRQLVERMGGRLWVESVPGQGSTFHFTAPFGRSTPRAPARAWLAGELRGKRALLVDDNPAALDALGSMLAAFGVIVERAASGVEALACLDRTPSAFTWLLIDWKMPGMDGIECARHILARQPVQRPCILLVTAFARDEALRASADLPLAGVLHKPVTPSSLHDCLVQARRPEAPPALRRSSSFASTARSDPARQRLIGASILLVEDQPMNRELACELLRRAGMTVTVANDGEEALRLLDAAGPFDGVLMDCQMPVMDGYTATRELRRDPRWQRLPVIAMTASALVEDRERALASGMNAHITKPIDVELMLRTMADWIAAEPRPATTAADASADLPVDSHTALTPADETAIDTADGLARCLGNRALYRRMLTGFHDGQRHAASALRADLDAGRSEPAARRLHDLKGLAGTIGARRLHAASDALLATLQTPADPHAALDRVEADLTDTLNQIDRWLAS